jgi:hypothetical protein
VEWNRPRCRSSRIPTRHGPPPRSAAKPPRGVSFEVSHGGISQQRSLPDLARAGRPESLVFASFGRQAHGHTGVQERDSQVAGVAALLGRTGIRGETNRCSLGAVFLEGGQLALPNAVPMPEWAMLWFFLHAGVAHDGTV